MTRADAVIIGGGSSGLSTAYWLTKLGMRNVVLLEKSYLSSGATGRCLGGIRAQFANEPDIRLALAAEKMYERLGSELGFDPLFKQDGYLFLAFDDQDLAMFERNSRIQNQHGVQSRMVTKEEVQELSPAMNCAGIVGGCYNKKDGNAVHFAVTEGFAEKARHQGADIRTFISVEQILASGGEVQGVQTSDGLIETNHVVCVAGMHTPGLLKQFGIEMPVVPVRREVLVTEPLRPFVRVMTVSLRGHSMFQTLRGEFVAECHDGEAEEETMSWSSTFSYAELAARKVLDLFPCLRDVHVVRQWAGTYDMSPDHRPIFQSFDNPRGLHVAVGFSGHGFMLAPMIGKIMAELVLEGQSSFDISTFRLERFADPNLAIETTVI